MSAKVTIFDRHLTPTGHRYGKMSRRYDGVVAHHPRVKAALKQAAEEVAAEARQNLAKHRFTGRASIRTEKGRLHHYVILAANSYGEVLSIEYGRRAGKPFVVKSSNGEKFVVGRLPTRETRILRDAARAVAAKG